MHKDINQLVRMDLNLLPILDTLLNEKSVSKTADKLNVTPPAISKSLNKIRDTFQDQLLVRSGMSLELTPLAVRLKPQLRELLDNIQTVLHQNIELNGSELPRSFNIVTNDILMSMLSYKLMKKKHSGEYPPHFLTLTMTMPRPVCCAAKRSISISVKIKPSARK
ncbi:hypothetical protein HA44_01290 [Mixta gaviniae]|nr:hypothetical protein HA44_01290 [Mixta gaviniae]